MKLRRLKILKFRNVQPGTELEFNDGYNVLLGQNGSGKTTLLRLITSVLRGDFRWLEKEAFGLEADLEMGAGRMALTIDHVRQEREERQLDALPSEMRSFVPTNDTWSTTIKLQATQTNGDVWLWNRNENGSTILRPGLTQPTTVDDMKWDPLSFIFSFALAIWAGFFEERLIPERQNLLKRLDGLGNELGHVTNTFRFDESLELFSAVTGRRTSLGKEEYALIPERITTTSNKFGSANVVAGILVLEAIRKLDALENPNFDSPADNIILRHDHAPFLVLPLKCAAYIIQYDARHRPSLPPSHPIGSSLSFTFGRRTPQSHRNRHQRRIHAVHLGSKKADTRFGCTGNNLSNSTYLEDIEFAVDVIDEQFFGRTLQGDGLQGIAFAAALIDDIAPKRSDLRVSQGVHHGRLGACPPKRWLAPLGWHLWQHLWHVCTFGLFHLGSVRRSLVNGALRYQFERRIELVVPSVAMERLLSLLTSKKNRFDDT